MTVSKEMIQESGQRHHSQENYPTIGARDDGKQGPLVGGSPHVRFDLAFDELRLPMNPSLSMLIFLMTETCYAPS